MKSNLSIRPARQRARVALLTLLLAGLGGACTAPPPTPAPTPEDHARAFRQHRDLADLQGLLPALALGAPRKAVESLLGAPDYCPTDQQCYYASKAKNPVGITYGLVVDYEVLNPFPNRQTPPPGTLQSVSLMAIAE
jgi:hypothetical protein